MRTFFGNMKSNQRKGSMNAESLEKKKALAVSKSRKLPKNFA